MEPLPLTPFEKYMVADERAGYPMTFPASWTVRGPVDVARLRQAYIESLRSHPLLTSCVRSGHWVQCDEATGPLEQFGPGDEPDAISRRLDVRRGPTVRANVRCGGETSTIEFVVHHAATDGVGMLEFCGDVFARYAAAGGSVPAPRRSPRPEKVTSRSVLDRSVPAPVSGWTVARTLVHESARFFTRRAEAVVTGSAPRGGGGEFAIADWQLTREQSAAIRAASAAAGATVNDWTILSLLRAIAAHNTDRRGDLGRRFNQRRWVVANMPVLMRPKSARDIPAANMIGYAFVARRRSGLADWRTALDSVAAETEAIRRWKYAGLFLDGLAWTARIPGGLWLATRPWLRPASCVISNLGDPVRRFRNRLPVDDAGRTVVGEFVLERLSGAAPIRPGTHVAGLVHGLSGRLNCSLRYAPSILSHDAVSGLLERWIDEMVEHA